MTMFFSLRLRSYSRLFSLAALLSAFVCFWPYTPASATEDVVKASVDILPVVEVKQGDGDLPETVTHETIYLTPDKSELVRLDREAGSIIVGNPRHMNVIADSSTTLIVVPRMPGASHFSVLDKSGDLIMQRQVIVASPKDKYIRVRKICSEDSKECQRTNVFYCPDMCHEIALPQDDDDSSADDSADNTDNAAAQAPSDSPPEE